MREGKQICPRMTRINANDFLSLGFFRVYSRDSWASLFVLRHSDCVRQNLFWRLADAILSFIFESSYPCYPCNPWFLMLYSCSWLNGISKTQVPINPKSQ
jgi:hypothetical protein